MNKEEIKSLVFVIAFLALAISELYILNLCSDHHDCLCWLLLWCVVNCSIIFIYLRKHTVNDLSQFCLMLLIAFMNIGIYESNSDLSQTKEFEHNIGIGVLSRTDVFTSNKTGSSYMAVYRLLRGGNYEYEVPISKNDWLDGKCDSMVLLQTNPSLILKHSVSTNDIQKYYYPIKAISKYQTIELGNNSYEYFSAEPEKSYENFGFNILYVAKRCDNFYMSFTDVCNKVIKMENYENSSRDTFLVYSNINPKFFDGWHVCPDSLCTSENFAKVEEGGYGYIFRGKVYSKDETEKYWNIIEQYKLREGAKKE